MVELEYGEGPRTERVSTVDLDQLFDRIAEEACRARKPQDVQVTVGGGGTLGIVVGADWSVLNHISADLDPPYKGSVGDNHGTDPAAFYVAGDHYSETPRRNTIPSEVARAAMRYFVATGELSPDVTWEEA